MRLDTGSGTVDMGARRFSPSTARFLQIDGYADALDDLGLTLDPLTGNPYSGHTSGTASPRENVKKRDSGHHMNKEGYGPAELDKSSKNRVAIRGREQQNVERYGGSQRSGGTSGNKINAVAPKKQAAYKAAANKAFGKGRG